MHSYATNSKDREIIPLWLAAIAVAFALLLNFSIKALNLEIPWWIDAPSVMGFYGIFYKLFDEFIWSWQVKKIRFSNIPNLQGTWVGSIQSSYNNNVYDDIYLSINQSWTNISVRIATETSKSYSTMASVNTLDASDSTLKYEYMNEPMAQSLQTMFIHRGNANLKLSPDCQMLEGDYFTGRGRQTYGSMKFVFISREILNRDKAISNYHSLSSKP
ncbi:MAG: hypothetical protein IM553_05595 [Microcystis sp. M57BS1]|uniref:Cap15 family cyclic dinucleotide receptor domain-containing protein n=1 Tax=Microcystis sp. M57BS1 TaxID=2771200 RepID=UPI0025830FE7|nr:hypothetical protein [Microcystis sp. M57BS1]MCA2533915.1 hypothetical protein [Microcystis sp. M57BS1]MCA6574039.1 hypothetical protein [Pseudanabaena sp. M53BS1SP1A06MG]MCA6581593.1 hypothetical protein [Pseudanabaena sp. M34BS1SP1A06MG]MCA6592385.1 hypothetical protein [Pseudanabaena sp. M38BS1SP1A06MG]